PVSMSQITTFDWPFERDVEAFVAAGVDGIGLSLRKLEAYGATRAAERLRTSGLSVSCVTSSGPYSLAQPTSVRDGLDSARRHIDQAAAVGAACLVVLPGHAPTLAWEEAAARSREFFEALLPDAARRGIRLAVEPVSQLRMDLGFLHSFADALDFV